MIWLWILGVPVVIVALLCFFAIIFEPLDPDPLSASPPRSARAASRSRTGAQSAAASVEPEALAKEALRGYKAGYLILAQDEQKVLVSGITNGSTYPYGARADATCGAGRAHSAPAWDCMCGFHAYAERYTAIHHALGGVEDSYTRGCPVLLTVALSGTGRRKVVAYTDGYRAAYQDVVGLEYLPICVVCLEKDQESPMALFQRAAAVRLSSYPSPGHLLLPVCLAHGLDSGEPTYSPEEVARLFGVEPSRVVPMRADAARGYVEPLRARAELAAEARRALAARAAVQRERLARLRAEAEALVDGSARER